ncbi:DUF397 domain-containing protein [Streptomyces aidingensis]|uniref:DUF397 domain-containing protein n=1 Tax=Streptomyces aidingensis TaxID=910347 RepID=A0A1I1V4N9_9ACTN|nr:DUF397 domain-containing protein [Streptomyces aidingensis]SFD77795.1 protein of unknown function [Streptomyces aidingensis]
MTEPNWFKSSYSGAPNADCVEVATLGMGQRAVRDSKSPRQRISVSTKSWRSFVRAVVGDLSARSKH